MALIMTGTPIQVDPRLLRPNPWNTNYVSPENETKLDEAMRRLGMFKPVVVRELPDGGFQILGGEHRRDSAIRIGLNPIPAFNLGPIPDKLAKEISLADNSRYGTDDAVQLAALLEELGSSEDLAHFLPYTEADLTAIFSSVSVALDALDEDGPEPEAAEPKAARASKTHTIMRFKVPIADSERLTALIQKTQKRHGYTEADELTNAGDALVHLLLGVDEGGDA